MTKSLHSDRYKAAISVLVAARKASGLTQAAMAERLGKPQSYVSKLERGERRIDVVEFIEFIEASDRDPMTAFEVLRNALAHRLGGA